MNSKKAIMAMSALSQPIRLAAVTTLARPGCQGMSVSDLAAALGGVLQNSMSVHMTVLARAGLVKGTKAGRETIYRVNRTALADVGAFVVQLASGH